uniref:PH_RBD domain-containing protein n=1 Tax=Steinernema glaseri TaxID=37863 RepID=A0A1I7Z9E0_9BILA
EKEHGVEGRHLCLVKMDGIECFFYRTQKWEDSLADDESYPATWSAFQLVEVHNESISIIHVHKHSMGVIAVLLIAVLC